MNDLYNVTKIENKSTTTGSLMIQNKSTSAHSLVIQCINLEYKLQR